MLVTYAFSILLNTSDIMCLYFSKINQSKMTLLKAFFTILLTACLSISFSASKDSFKDIPYVIGGDFIFHKRTGSYLFESNKTKQNVERPNLLQGGASVGKRYYAAPWLRFQLMCLFHLGKKDEDSTYYTMEYIYRHLGFDLDLHFVLQESRKVDSYILLGGGFNYMHMFMEFIPPDYNGLDAKRWYPSANGGAGLDIRFSKRLGLSIAYSFRFWQPLKYLYKTDLPITAIEYRETFYSHMAQVQLLFNLDGS